MFVIFHQLPSSATCLPLEFNDKQRFFLIVIWTICAVGFSGTASSFGVFILDGLFKYYESYKLHSNAITIPVV